jgi:uroporphyrinogen decarboxylase
MIDAMSTATSAATATASIRERALAVLRYQPCRSLPLVHFGWWHETLQKWAAEGHISAELARSCGDGNWADQEIGDLLGFECNWASACAPNTALRPGFAREVIRTLPDGSRHERNHDGVTELVVPGAGSIPAEIDHLLTDRASYETHYRHRYEWHPDRVAGMQVRLDGRRTAPFHEGGAEFLRSGQRTFLYGIFCGSLIGSIRNVIGVERLSYLSADDPELLKEIIDLNADTSYRSLEAILATGAKFDFGHFWEDICYKNGPLVSPRFHAKVVAPHYRRFADLLGGHGIDIVSLDCDGCIDALVPHWLDNGVNTMFPIEVGTWRASLAPWRQKYGRQVRGVGGMDKVVFGRDRAAIDAEVERMKPLVELGGFLPCPDHRIPPDAKWDLVRYYCDRMRATFG